MSRVIVVGAGIAGITAALGLQKAGFSPVVYEAHPGGTDTVGAFLTLWPNGMDAFQILGVAEKVVDHSFAGTGFGTWNSAGELLRHKELPPESRTMKRATLYTVLQNEALQRGIPIEHGKRVADIHRFSGLSGSDLEMVFTDGTSAEADVVVGADGLHSTIRYVIDKQAPQPRYTGLQGVRGYVDLDRIPTGMRVPNPGEWSMIFGRRAFFGCTTIPTGQLWWFANIAAEIEPDRDMVATTPRDRWVDQLLELFSDDVSPASDIVAVTEDISASNSYDLPMLPRWYDDSMVVIGDAAHATSPSAAQGACMAAEDGVQIARCLRDNPIPADAFRVFEHLRRDRAEEIIENGERLGQRKIPAQGKDKERDRQLLEDLNQPENSRGDWIGGHRIDWDRSTFAEVLL